MNVVQTLIYVAMIFFVFFPEVLKILQSQIYFYMVRLVITFYGQWISIVKRKENSVIEQRRLNGHEKRDRLLVLKMEFSYGISYKFYLLIRFSQNGLILSKKVSIINCSKNSKSLKTI